MYNNASFTASPYLLVNSVYLVLLPLSCSQKGPMVTILPQVLEMWVLAGTLQASRLQLPGTHISHIILIRFFRWPGLSSQITSCFPSPPSAVSPYKYNLPTELQILGGSTSTARLGKDDKHTSKERDDWVHPKSLSLQSKHVRQS